MAYQCGWAYRRAWGPCLDEIEARALGAEYDKLERIP